MEGEFKEWLKLQKEQLEKLEPSDNRHFIDGYLGALKETTEMILRLAEENADCSKRIYIANSNYYQDIIPAISIKKLKEILEVE